MMRLPACLSILLLSLGVATVDAQTGPVDPGTSRTRAELESLLSRYETVLTSPEFSQSEKQRVRPEAEAIRNRLQFGDFRVGDRIWLQVEGEPELPDTVTVQPGSQVTLPVFGEISVMGVLRSEIQGHLTSAFRGFIRDPIVRAVPLMRVSIIGSIGNPGFYTMPADMVLGDALMVAGGPGGNANLNGITVLRGTEEVLEEEEVQEALRNGLTLDQLNLQAGDQIVVPQQGQGWWRTGLAVVGAVSSLTWIVWRFAR